MNQYHNNLFRGLEASNKKMKLLCNTTLGLADAACLDAELVEQDNDKIREINAGAITNNILNYVVKDYEGIQLRNLEQIMATKGLLKKLRADIDLSQELMEQDNSDSSATSALSALGTGEQLDSFAIKRKSLLTKQEKLQMRLTDHGELFRWARTMLNWAKTENMLLNLEYMELIRANVSADYQAQFPGYHALVAEGLEKTSLCRFWVDQPDSICLNGAGCIYAHGPDDLRIKTCNPFVQSGSCPYGDTCNFFHPD